MVSQSAPVAVIGGSGFYEFLDDATEVLVETPYGAPSADVAIGRVGGRDGGVPAPARERATRTRHT